MLSRRTKLLEAIYGHPITRRIEPTIRRLMRGGGMTLGVRIAVLDGDKVLLVRHGYTKGWHFPGGGVDPGETAVEGAKRELMEETGCRVLEEPTLHGLYFHPKRSRRDHVALYVARRSEQGAKPPANTEILDSGFFLRSALPEGTTKPTRRRLDELFGGRAAGTHW